MSFLEVVVALSFILAIVAAVPVSLFLLSAVQWYRMNSAARERRLFLLRTSGGRESGWYAECDGKKIAVLTDAKYFDMFWVSYRMDPMEPGTKNSKQIQDPNYWLSNCLAPTRTQPEAEAHEPVRHAGLRTKIPERFFRVV